MLVNTDIPPIRAVKVAPKKRVRSACAAQRFGQNVGPRKPARVAEAPLGKALGAAFESRSRFPTSRVC